MKPALSYTLKVWLTTLGIAYVVLLIMVFYGLSKPDHSKELDPFFATYSFLMLNLVFLPAWFVFALCITPITKRVLVAWRQKVVFCAMAIIVIASTVIPLSIMIYPDVTYYQIGTCYLACMFVGIWLYSPAGSSAPLDPKQI